MSSQICAVYVLSLQTDVTIVCKYLWLQGKYFITAVLKIFIHSLLITELNQCSPHKNVFYLVCEAIGTAAIPGLLCQPRVIVKMIVEKQMECRLPEETEILGENLPQRHFGVS
jgi:hypothetical protein